MLSVQHLVPPNEALRKLSLSWFCLLEMNRQHVVHSSSHVWQMEGPELEPHSRLLAQCSFHHALASLEHGLLIYILLHGLV